MPGLKLVTSAPTDSISPAASRPGTSGSFGCIRYWPWRNKVSAKLIPAERTLITTVPGFASGFGTSPRRRTSGPPNFSKMTAFMMKPHRLCSQFHYATYARLRCHANGSVKRDPSRTHGTAQPVTHATEAPALCTRSSTSTLPARRKCSAFALLLMTAPRNICRGRANEEPNPTATCCCNPDRLGVGTRPCACGGAIRRCQSGHTAAALGQADSVASRCGDAVFDHSQRGRRLFCGFRGSRQLRRTGEVLRNAVGQGWVQNGTQGRDSGTEGLQPHLHLDGHPGQRGDHA